jgi:hypothetical protein
MGLPSRPDPVVIRDPRSTGEELEEVRVLRVQPGDTIVITVDSALRQKEFDEVAARLKDRFPDNEVLVLGGAPIELSVVRPDA